MENSRPRGSFVGPVILIGLGVIFLLNNLGILAWSVWDALFRLWPVLLIAVGLDLLIGRRSNWGGLLVALLLAGVLAGAVWLYSQRPTSGQPLAGEEIRQPLQGAQRAEITIRFSTGSLRLDALSDSSQLIEGTIQPNEGEKVTKTYTLDGETAHFEVASSGGPIFPFFGRRNGFGQWTLGLTPQVPMTLNLDTGVGDVSLDLSELEVTDLDLNAGVGRTTLTLPARGQLQGKIDGGVGEIVIIVPSGVAGQIRVNAGLGRVSVPDGFQRAGDVYTMPDFADAEDRVDLEVNGGVGNITIREQS